MWYHGEKRQVAITSTEKRPTTRAIMRKDR